MAHYRSNATPVWLLSPGGPGHDLTKDHQRTKCGEPATGAVEVTWVQVHVWRHGACVHCFGSSAAGSL